MCRDGTLLHVVPISNHMQVWEIGHLFVCYNSTDKKKSIKDSFSVIGALNIVWYPYKIKDKFRTN